MKKNHRSSRLKYAVSEVFSVILILTITVTIFVTVSYFVLSDPGPAPKSMTELHGRVKDNSFIIEPTKGEPLSLDTICVLEIGGIKSNYKVRDFLETKSKQDGEWNLGERATFQLGNFSYFKVSFKVISREKDFVLWDELIQDGIVSNYDYIVLSLEPTDIQDGSANLWLGYNFGDKTGSVRFSYREYGENWINTSWVSKYGFGTYNESITGLNPNKIYFFKAQLICESNTINGEEIPIMQDSLTSVDKIQPYNTISLPYNISATGPNYMDEINLYYRWSEDNISWGTSTQIDDISVDSTSSSQNSGVSSITWSHTVGSHNNRILLVCSGVEDELLDYIITNVEFNGQALTKAHSEVVTSLSGYSASSEIWYLLNPDSGTHNIEVTYSGNVLDCSVGAITLYNVLQQSPTTVGSNTNEGTNEISTEITTLSKKSIIIDMATCGNANTFWQGSGQIEFFERTASSSCAVGSYKILQNPGSTIIWENNSGANRLSHVVVVFAPSTSVVGCGKNWTLWANSSNPDKTYPWNWNFTFPHGNGYYEFYCLGSYSDYNEVIPSTADAICYYESGTKVDIIKPFNQTISPTTITATGNSNFDSVVLYYLYSDVNITWNIGAGGDIIWSSELLTNPSFESGSMVGWSNAGGGTMTVGTDCPYGARSPHQGSYYIYSLSSGFNVNGFVYQDVSLDSYAIDIDAGRAKINVTGWLVSDEYNYGIDPPYDEFFMNVKFYDGSNDLITGYGYESGGTNPVSQGSGNHISSWDQYGITNYDIPAGARKVRVSFYTWEYDGSSIWDGGSADDFSVKVGISGSSSDWLEVGTDMNSPWSWSFDFPNGTGYYGFYSIGKIDGSDDEQTPLIADAICCKK